MKRLPLTLLTTIALFGVYRVYALVLGPMTHVRVMPVAPPAARIAGQGHASHSARDAAREYLAHRPWAQQAKFTWEQLDQKFIYFNEIGPVEKGPAGERNQYRFRPFAMVVKNSSRPEEAPTVLVADEARVTFKNPIEQFGAGDGGENRIVGAELDTGVALTGPNGLSLTGRNFVFSEATRSLYSDEPLQFAYGPTAKSQTRFVCDAEDIAITLESGDNDLFGKDLPRITDFEHLTLRRNVRFQIDYESRGQLTPVRVTSAGSFEFNRQQRKASFDRDVQVVQQTGVDPPFCNVLKCQRLEMLFDETPVEPAVASADVGKKSRRQQALSQKMRSLAGLALHYIVATSPDSGDPQVGQRVKFVSDENLLTASMEQMTFDAQKGVLSLTDPLQAEITRHDFKAKTLSRLLTRRLLVGLEEIGSDSQGATGRSATAKKFGGVEWVVCVGKGKLLQIDEESQERLLTATWDDRLSLNPDENVSDASTAPRLLELSGNVNVIHGMDGKLAADLVTLTLAPDVFNSLDGERKSSLAASRLPVQRAVAKGNVRFAWLEAEGGAGVLDLRFAAGTPPVMERRTGKNRQAAASNGARITSPPWELQQAQRIEGEVVIDPESRQAGLRHAIVEGPLKIHRAALASGATDPASGAVTITGLKLAVTNDGADRQLVVLHGRMHGERCVERARIAAGAAFIEGQRIALDRASSQADVDGQTEVCWPVSGDLTGRKLTNTMLMTISCADGLTFDGQEAAFSRSVVVKLQDESRLSCEELLVRLDRPWSMTAPTNPRERPEVSVIRSPGRVRIDMLEWENKSTLARVVEADLGTFEAHPGKSDGAFTGNGPGTIRQWQRGSFHFRVTPEASASANRPASSAELPWNFVQLDFEGKLSGNLHQRIATFDDRVKAIYAPVGQARMAFARSQLSDSSESAKRGVWMGCDQLNISLTEPRRTAPNGFVSLSAQGGVSLEAQKIQAIATQITFEEEKDLFELRGRGEQMASIYVESEGGTGRVPGRVIQINPKTGSHKIVEAGTVTGGR
jgi:hypothetical protein